MPNSLIKSWSIKEAAASSNPFDTDRVALRIEILASNDLG